MFHVLWGGVGDVPVTVTDLLVPAVTSGNTVHGMLGKSHRASTWVTVTDLLVLAVTSGNTAHGMMGKSHQVNICMGS